jgi:nitroreductase
LDVAEALRTTRAMRRLAPTPVPDGVISRILDAGIRAPAPGTAQTWRFVVVTDRDVMASIADLWRSTRDELLELVPNLYQSDVQARSSQYLHDHFAEVPLLICGYGPPGSQAIVAPALWSMCIAARSEGVGSTFTTLLTRAPEALATILGVPDDSGLDLIGTLPMGYPLGRWGAARRQPIEEVVFAQRWGTPSDWTTEEPS